MSQPVETIVHIPTPGDHYSSASGSAVMTVIYELSRWHQKSGGRTELIVGKGTRHDYPIGECIEVEYAGLPGRNQKIADVLSGRLGMPRRFLSNAYAPAFRALEPLFCGVVIGHNAPAALRGMKEAAPTARVVLYCHNTLFGTYSNSETRRAVQSADIVICVSEFLADDLKRRLGTRDKRVYGITNGVDIERFQPSPSPPDVNVPVILYVGRVSPEKGPDLLVKAAVKLANSKRKFKLKIVGSSNFNASDPLTSYEQDLRRTAASVPGYVEFQPFVDRSQVVAQYQAASIFCAPSNCDEGCSLTVPEAMACGLPTVASSRGGIPEVGGDAILYFKTPDTDELAQQLEYLLDSSDARSVWGQKARAQAEAKCWENQYKLVRQALFE